MEFQQIDARRSTLALTQKDLCALADVNPTTYSLIKLGRRDGLAGTYRKLSAALDRIEAERNAGPGA